MKTKLAMLLARGLVGGAILGAVLLLAGCFEQRLRWAPDGAHAAVVGHDGLYLCDASGKLSPLLLPGARLAGWCGDSRRLVVAVERAEKNWRVFAEVLGPEWTQRIEAEADDLWRRVQGGAPWGVVTMDLKERKHLVKICLRERHGPELRARLSAGDWEELATKDEKLTELRLARREGEGLNLGEPLFRGVGDVVELRVAPGDRAVAFTCEMKPESEELQLMAALLDGSAPPVVVARHVAWYPDWTPDGRALVGFEASGGEKDELRLGVLARREVFAADGRLLASGELSYLAGAMFNGFSRVRCLRDGRVLFNAAEITLPLAAEDYGDQREQLFAVDPARQATLVRLVPRKRESDLPQQLVFFEVSPDEQRVVLGTSKGEVAVLTLASGAVEPIQGAGSKELQSAPVWRPDGELTYVRRPAAPKTPGPVGRVEFVLRRGETETVLSAGWTDEMIKMVAGEN